MRRGLLFLLMLAGCASPEPPVDHFYRLQWAAPASRLALAGGVQVLPPRAEGLLRGREVVFVKNPPLELAPYRYHLWQDPPATLLQRALGDHLRQAGVTVITPEQRDPPAYVLEGRLARLEHLPGQGVALALELTLRRERDGRTLFQGRYDWERPLADPEPAAAVALLNQGLGEVAGRFVAELGRHRPFPGEDTGSR